MKTLPLALLLLLTFLPGTRAQTPTVRPQDSGMVRVSVVFWDVRQFSLRHRPGEPQIAPNLPGPTVEASDRQWATGQFVAIPQGGGITLKSLLKAYPHRNPDGTETVIVDLTVTEVGGPNSGAAHRLWNMVTTGRNGVGSAPPADDIFGSGIAGDFSRYANVGRFRLGDGSGRCAMVSVTILPPTKG